MEFTQKQNTQIVATLLLLTVASQAIYTAMYQYASDVPRQWLWGIEALLFVLLAAVAGSALAQAKSFTLGFSAIFASAILNLIQVGVGLTQFGAFREAAQAVEGMAPAAGGIFALSFFVYNAAKCLLGIAAVVIGSAASKAGTKALGNITMLAGVVALATNAIVMMFGRMGSVPSGATGVVATLLLALCLYKLQSED